MTDRELSLYLSFIEIEKKKERFSNPDYRYWVEKLLNSLQEKYEDSYC